MYGSQVQRGGVQIAPLTDADGKTEGCTIDVVSWQTEELPPENDIDSAEPTLGRMLTILKTMVGQIDILETMTPVSFLSFRSFLANSSGFQSAQFREWEFMLGHKRPAPLSNRTRGRNAFRVGIALTIFFPSDLCLCGHSPAGCLLLPQ